MYTALLSTGDFNNSVPLFPESSFELAKWWPQKKDGQNTVYT